MKKKMFFMFLCIGIISVTSVCCFAGEEDVPRIYTKLFQQVISCNK